MPGIYQVPQALREIKIVDGVVTQRQVQYGVKGHRLNDAGSDIEDEHLLSPAVLHKALSGHSRHLRLFVLTPVYRIQRWFVQEKIRAGALLCGIVFKKRKVYLTF